MILRVLQCLKLLGHKLRCDQLTNSLFPFNVFHNYSELLISKNIPDDSLQDLLRSEKNTSILRASASVAT